MPFYVIRCLGLAVVLLAFGGPTAVRAQPSAQQRQAAAEAYDRGSAAYLAGESAEAARWFETAHRLAPSAAALVQAVRAHSRAGDEVRAATLALRLRALYGDDATAARTATSVLQDVADLVRVDIECIDCTVDLDGTLLEWPSFFIRAGSEHHVAAHFATGDVERPLLGESGEHVELELEAPPGDGGSGRRTDTDALVGSLDERPEGGEGLSPIFVAGAGALTAIALGVTVWSGIDTLSGVDAYESDPTEEGLKDGQSRERRTNVLIATTAGLSAITAALALFTDWNAELLPSTRATVGIGPGGAVMGMEGRF